MQIEAHGLVMTVVLLLRTFCVALLGIQHNSSCYYDNALKLVLRSH